MSETDITAVDSAVDVGLLTEYKSVEAPHPAPVRCQINEADPLGTESPNSGADVEASEDPEPEQDSITNVEISMDGDDVSSEAADPPPIDEPTQTISAEAPAAAQDAPAAQTAKPPATKKRTPDTPAPVALDGVQSFADFLRYLIRLDADLKPVELAKSSSARAALTKQVELDEVDDLIADVAARDTKLATALALMLTVEKSDLRGFARQNMTALAAQILRRHPAFCADTAFGSRLTRLVAGDLENEALPLSIIRMQNLVNTEFDGKATMKAPILQTLSDNAAHTLVLIAASAANWELADCIDVFADTIWGADEALVESTSAREKIATLPKGARKAAALIVRSTRGRIQSVQSEHDRVSARAQALEAESQRLSDSLIAARARCAEIEEELNLANLALRKEAESRLNERMAATSDFEAMRSGAARVISDQIESLEDALDALEHGYTKITDEYVRRSVDYLRRSLSTLQPRPKKSN